MLSLDFTVWWGFQCGGQAALSGTGWFAGVSNNVFLPVFVFALETLRIFGFDSCVFIPTFEMPIVGIFVGRD